MGYILGGSLTRLKTLVYKINGVIKRNGELNPGIIPTTRRGDFWCKHFCDWLTDFRNGIYTLLLVRKVVYLKINHVCMMSTCCAFTIIISL